jgi:hypothetical protein
MSRALRYDEVEWPEDPRDEMDRPQYDACLGYSETGRQRAARLKAVADQQEQQAAMNNGTYRQWKQKHELERLQAQRDRLEREIRAREGR